MAQSIRRFGSPNVTFGSINLTPYIWRRTYDVRRRNCDALQPAYAPVALAGPLGDCRGCGCIARRGGGAHGWPGRRGRDAGDELRRRSGGQVGERTHATAAPADGSSAGRP